MIWQIDKEILHFENLGFSIGDLSEDFNNIHKKQVD
jgi:hypothetical protein